MGKYAQGPLSLPSVPIAIPKRGSLSRLLSGTPAFHSLARNIGSSQGQRKGSLGELVPAGPDQSSPSNTSDRKSSVPASGDKFAAVPVPVKFATSSSGGPRLGKARRTSGLSEQPAVLNRLGSWVGFVPAAQEGPEAPLRKIKTLEENLALLRFAARVTVSPRRARDLNAIKRFLEHEEYEIVSRYGSTHVIYVCFPCLSHERRRLLTPR